MTTIAYRDGIVAANTGGSRGATIIDGFRKIARTSDGTLVGAAGTAVYMAAMIRWADGGMVSDQPVARADDDGCDAALIIRADDVIEVHEVGGFYTISAAYCAIGSGRDQALGAMFAGADVETAVRASISHDAWTNGDVVCVQR